MLRTRLCDVLGIDLPIVQGPLGGPWGQSVELPAAVSNAGGLGSIATSLRGSDDVRRDVRALRALTDRPFAANIVRRPYSEEVFVAILEDPPPVVSVALGAPLDAPRRAHDVGSLFLQQVTTVAQAEQAAEAGADVISAQGSESGGFSGLVSTLALVPQVVDAVAPIPVIASGGIADGRGLAAALALGATGINIGTRFLATDEAGIPDDWKRAIVAARSEDAVKLSFVDLFLPGASEGGYPVAPRSLRTPFVDRWNDNPDAAASVDEIKGEADRALREERAHELIPMTGQTAGLIDEILPAAEVVRRLVAEAERAIQSLQSVVRTGESSG